jgi:hypothetical protein
MVDGNNGDTFGGNYVLYCHKSGHFRQKCTKLKKKETRYSNNQPSNNNYNCELKNYDSQNVVLLLPPK